MLPGKDFNHAQQQHYRVHSGKYISLRKKRAGDASFALPAASKLFARCFPDDPPPFFVASCPGPISPPLAEKPSAGADGYSQR